MSDTRTVVVARFGAAHGIKGEVRLKSFTQAPEDVVTYGPLSAADGRAFEILAARPAAGSSSPDMLIVRVKGVTDRTAAEKLTNLDLSVSADRLPAPDEDEFYHADLVGLAAFLADGAAFGTVVSVQNYGAGDLLEIAPAAGPAVLVPFTRAAVPGVDLAAGKVVIDPPAGLLDGQGEAAEEER